MTKYEELVEKLKEIFQLDRPELDFGIYRIFNQRAVEIGRYLDEDLKAAVEKAFSEGGNANKVKLEAELEEAIEKAQSLGVDPEVVPAVKEKRTRLEKYKVAGDDANEGTVYTHLLTFFARYYDKADFISKRRYKGDTYAIPYSGEEVVLHWANKDQYYIKSSEAFSNYTIRLEDGRAVHFRLVQADTAKSNNKDQNLERRFMLSEAETPYVAEGGDLVIPFEYAPVDKNTKQSDLNKAAVRALLEDAAIAKDWRGLAARMPTEKNPSRTLLEKHLTDYTARNSSDYFIHKDLKKFLSHELDFYIKNEVMNLDDVQNAATFKTLEKNLRMIQVLRAIALDLIDFMEQIEEFQKKLWLKKKFVVESNWCITLDRVPEELYPEIAANSAQWVEWKKLGLIVDVHDLKTQKDGELALGDQKIPEIGTVDYLKAFQYMLIDTAFYDTSFKYNLLAAIPDLDVQTDGLLINSDNFQSLNLLQTRFREQVGCIYIDPPYNTGGDGFFYKDAYQHSSWLSMISDRLQLALPLLDSKGVLFASIDANEQRHLQIALNNTFGSENRVEEIIWAQNTTKNQSPTYSTNHEYVEVYARDLNVAKKDYAMFREKKVGFTEIMQLVDELNPSFPKIKDVESALRKLFSDHKLKMKKLKTPPAQDPWKGIYNYNRAEYRTNNGSCIEEADAIKTKAQIWIWREVDVSMPQVKEDSQKSEFRDPNDPTFRFYQPLHPLTGKACPFPKRGWSWPYQPYGNQASSFTGLDADKRIAWGDDENKIPQRKSFLHEVETNVAKSVVNDFTDGEKELTLLFGKTRTFSGPKPTTLISRFCQQATSTSDIMMDFFCGSGTTGHAVINLNREDNGHRKYILVEMGDYFDSVLKPRIQKVIYSDSWKDGKPTNPVSGISQCFKYLRLESYEDTLNNLQLKRSETQQELLLNADRLPPDVKKDYLLKYMLDVESRASLLNTDDFKKPFDYWMEIAGDSAGATIPKKVDLVETFNYLLGLRVKSIDARLNKGYLLVDGEMPNGNKTLIIWRDCEQVDYETLNRICEQNDVSADPNEKEFDVIYVNGDHNIPHRTTRTEDEGGITRSLKIRQIEEEFLTRMFNVAGE